MASSFTRLGEDLGRARRRVRPAANTLEERGAERDRAGGDADCRRARAIRAVGVVVEQHLVDDVKVALARQDVDLLEIRRLPDAILDLVTEPLLDDGAISWASVKSQAGPRTHGRPPPLADRFMTGLRLTRQPTRMISRSTHSS